MATRTTSPPKSRRWWILAVALLAVSVAGFARIMNFSLRGQPADSVADVAARKFVVSLGYVDLENGVRSLQPSQPGRVAEVLVHEGDSVIRDEPLLRMIDDLPRAKAEQARLEWDDAKGRLEEARVKLPEQHRLDLQNQAAAVAMAKYRLSALETIYQNKLRLSKSPVGVSDTEVAVAKQEVETGQTGVQVEETKLKQLQLRDPQSEVRRLETQAATLNAVYNQAQAALADFTIRAPRNGFVLRIGAGPGDALMPGSPKPAIEFGVEGPRIVRAEVEQAYADPIVPGLAVSIEDSANATNRRWTGHVTRVGDWYTQKRNVIADPGQVNDVRTIECVIALDPNQPPLKINQQVVVKIQLP
jgi:multidrug resistance efflux pump